MECHSASHPGAWPFAGPRSRTVSPIRLRAWAQNGTLIRRHHHHRRRRRPNCGRHRHHPEVEVEVAAEEGEVVVEGVK
jgi:hypothetical protein